MRFQIVSYVVRVIKFTVICNHKFVSLDCTFHRLKSVFNVYNRQTAMSKHCVFANPFSPRVRASVTQFFCHTVSNSKIFSFVLDKVCLKIYKSAYSAHILCLPFDIMLYHMQIAKFCAKKTDRHFRLSARFFFVPRQYIAVLTQIINYFPNALTRF